MEETEKKAYLAMWNGEHGADRNPKNYQREDDGSHIYHNEKEYYEWWYLDASFDNDYHVVITYHYRNMFLKPMIPSIQIYIYHPDGKKTVGFKPIAPENASANPNYCDVKMGDSWLRDFGNHYEMYMKIDGVGARLRFKNTVPSWKPGTGFNYKNEETGFVSGWVVPVPHADVEGELYIDGKTVQVKGSGYHDHNWGNCYCYKLFKNWYWGRVHSDHYSIDYAQVIPAISGMPSVNPLLIASKDEIILSTNMLNVELLDETEDTELGQTYAKKIILNTESQGVKFDMEIETHRIIDGFKLPKVTEESHFYYRFLGDFKLKIEVDGKKETSEGTFLHELMLL